MFRKENKWKYTNFKRKLLSYEKIIKLSKKNNVYIYDPRIFEVYKKGHIANTTHVSFNKINKQILSHKKWDKIILIGAEERSNASLASWAKYNGYWRVFLLKDGINHIPKKYLKKK